METVLLDVRQALRALLRAPGYALAAIISLGLGIGANTAIFTVYRSALLEPLPVAEPGELVHLRTQRGDNFNENFSYPHYQALNASGVFAGLLAHSPVLLALRSGNTTEQLEGVAVSPNYFSVLGVPLQQGRSFGAEHEQAGSARVIILSELLWQRMFAQRDNVIGEVVQLNNQPFTVIGVAPASFAGLTRAMREEFWIPLTAYAAVTGNDYTARPEVSWLNVVGRRQAAATLESTQTRLQALDVRMRAEQLLGETHRNLISPASRGLAGSVSELERPLRYLMAAVAFVLLIACANVASLLVARTAARQKDLAVRLAIGGSRLRLLRQLMTESLALSLAAGATGLLLASWLTDLLAAYRPALSTMPLALDTRPDATILGFTLIVSLGTGLIFGLGPALFSTPRDLMPLLKNSAGRATARLGTRGMLVSAQVALSLALVVGALLLARTMRQLNDINLGFTTRTALLASVDFDAGGYSRERGALAMEQLLQRVRALPGVSNASAARTINPFPAGSRMDGIALEGSNVPANEVGFDLNVVDEQYFTTMGITIESGRDFTAGDRPGATQVAIINEEMARRFWPGQNAIGRRMVIDSASNTVWEVVGVARDGKYRGLREAGETNVWRPLRQAPRNLMTLIVHTRAQPLALAHNVRNELRALDPAIPLFEVRTLDQHIALATSRERMATQLALAFSVLALILSGLGLYGLLAFTVAQQTREIGVRMALGAPRTLVLRQTMTRGLKLVAAGLLFGVPAALIGTRLLGSLLYGITAGDPFSFLAGACVLICAGVAASVLPARRAVRVDPVVALRSE